MLKVTEMRVLVNSGGTGVLLLGVVLLTWDIFFVAQDSFTHVKLTLPVNSHSFFSFLQTHLNYVNWKQIATVGPSSLDTSIYVEVQKLIIILLLTGPCFAFPFSFFFSFSIFFYFLSLLDLWA